MNEPDHHQHQHQGNLLLMPLAIVVASAIIGAGLYFGLKENAGESGGQTIVVTRPESSASAAARPAPTRTIQTTATTAAALPSTSELFVQYAADIGADKDKFKSCMDGGTHRAAIQAEACLASQLGATGTPTFFINGKRLIGAQPFAVFQEIIDRELDGSAPSEASGYSAAVAQLGTRGRFNPDPVSLDIGDSPRKGSGPVTLVEFTDYQCPFCSRFFTNTLPDIEREYEGKVTFVVKDLPLTNIHSKALVAAEAARCAGEQGEFWDMHDILFNSQAQWTRAS